MVRRQNDGDFIVKCVWIATWEVPSLHFPGESTITHSWKVQDGCPWWSFRLKAAFTALSEYERFVLLQENVFQIEMSAKEPANITETLAVATRIANDIDSKVMRLESLKDAS